MGTTESTTTAVSAVAVTESAEHRSATLGDLAALVAGIAVVLVLPTQQTYWPEPTDFLGPWPRWLPWLFCLRQTLGAACIALVPVVLRRRFAYGGIARPAECLVLFAAMPFLAESIETALIKWTFWRQTGIKLSGPGLDGMPTKFLMEWQDKGHWIWEQAVMIAGAVSVAGGLIARRWLPGWLLTLFVVIAWLGAYDAPILLRRNVGHLIFRHFGALSQIHSHLIHAVFQHFPRTVLYVVPASAAIRSMVGADRARATWLEMTSLVLAAGLFLVAEPTEAARQYFANGRSPSALTETLFRAGTLFAALLLGIVAMRFRQRNRRQ